MRMVILSAVFWASLFTQAAEGERKDAIVFNDTGWQEYQNPREKYRLRLPFELKKNFEKQNAREWAAANIMPFDYVNFGPGQSAAGGNMPFELGVGVHANLKGLSAREFADIKDEGVKRSVQEYVIVRSGEVAVSGIPGVRDDFALLKDSGWWSYSRVIIPFQDRFFVFLGTLGREKAAAEYERVFQSIIDTFEIID